MSKLPPDYGIFQNKYYNFHTSHMSGPLDTFCIHNSSWLEDAWDTVHKYIWSMYRIIYSASYK